MSSASKNASTGLISAVIVDDDYLSRDLLTRFVAADPDCSVSGVFADGQEAWQAIERQQPDLLLLDIEVPSVDGMQIAARLAELPRPPQVLFVTAHEEHALRAFELQAVDYLVKPLQRQRFQAALQRAKLLIRSGRQNADETDRKRAASNGNSRLEDPDSPSFLIAHGDEVFRVVPQQISWAEAASQYVVLHTDHGDFVRAESLSAFSRRLKHCTEFLRVHRSALINGARVKKVVKTSGNSYRIVLDCGSEIALARSRKSLLSDILEFAQADDRQPHGVQR
jgi:two-component system LytT family response regulator